VFVYLAFNEMLYAALIVFFAAGATDVVDGYLARRNNWISEIGKILDPFADKLMQCTVLVVLCILEVIPIWFVIPYILKEAVTLFMGLLVIKKRKLVVVSKWYGKAAVCIFYLTIAMSIVFEEYLAAHPVVGILIFIPSICFAFGALAGYLKHYSSLKNPNSELSRSAKID
jgi:cardiolipin synthase